MHWWAWMEESVLNSFVFSEFWQPRYNRVLGVHWASSWFSVIGLVSVICIFPKYSLVSPSAMGSYHTENTHCLGFNLSFQKG